jgi:hypothetical protein
VVDQLVAETSEGLEGQLAAQGSLEKQAASG